MWTSLLLIVCSLGTNFAANDANHLENNGSFHEPHFNTLFPEELSIHPSRRVRRQEETCVLPDRPEGGSYVVTNDPTAAPGYTYEAVHLTFMCNRGHDLQGPTNVFCVRGVWSREIPKCTKKCKLAPHPSVEYWCGARVCTDEIPNGGSVQPQCVQRHNFPDPLAPMICTQGVFDYKPVCFEDNTIDCGVPTVGRPLVINGKRVERGELPWHVGIYDKNTSPYMQICGGTIVSTTLVISAAHCFWTDLDKLRPAVNFAVGGGKIYRPWLNKRDVGAQYTDVKDIKVPDLYLGSTARFQEDIALVIVATPFSYTDFIRPACLDFNFQLESTQLQEGNLGKVGGWGLSNSGVPSQVLLAAELPFVPLKQCVANIQPQFTVYLTTDKFCAGYRNGTAVCKGDSGGGLLFWGGPQGKKRYYLRGVVSVAPPSDKPCNDNSWTAFTQVRRHDQFITPYLPPKTQN